jgi:hypothetical protein
MDLEREEFEREVEQRLTGQETEPWELINFKLNRPVSQCEPAIAWSEESRLS